MSKDELDKDEIIDKLSKIGGLLVQISSAVDAELCKATRDCDSDWDVSREIIMEHFQELIPLHSFSLHLPNDELGITAQAAIANLLYVQSSFHHIVVMLDMIRGEPFNEIYMDALASISRKVHDSIVAFHTMLIDYTDNPESVKNGLEVIKKLERQVDEENIIICRQITVATGGDSSYICYLMRKIVGQLEHITDYIEECAEIVDDL